MKPEFLNTFMFNVLIAVLFGVVISYIDLHSEEVQSAVLLLLIFSFVLGYKHPQKAWLYSLILGLSVITGFIFSRLTGFVPKGIPPDNIFSSLLALIPAYIGGYLGVFIKSIKNAVN